MEKLIQALKNDDGRSIFRYFSDGNTLENNPMLLKSSPLKRITLKKTILGESMSCDVNYSQQNYFINNF